jgi:hypothetical protein
VVCRVVGLLPALRPKVRRLFAGARRIQTRSPTFVFRSSTGSSALSP